MEHTKPMPFAFVLMPFDQTFEDIYHLGIKAVCVDSGIHCERVDEQIFDESILARIYNQIAKADFIISDMTGRNPNVFYETEIGEGYQVDPVSDLLPVCPNCHADIHRYNPPISVEAIRAIIKK